MAYFTGRTCYVTIGSNTVQCGSWEADHEIKFADVTTGASGGAEQGIPTTDIVTGTIEGPWPGSSNPFPPRTLVLLNLVPGDGGPSITCNAWLSRVRGKVTPTDANRFTAQFRSDGAVTGI